MSGILHKTVDEIGISRLLSAPRDAHWLMIIRLWRLFAFGQCSIVIVQFFKALSFSERQTGLFMALTLAGDMVMSLFLTHRADRLGRRRVLLWGALMMAISGAVFATSSNYYMLLAASIIGVISPSGGDIGPFRAVEESALAHILPLEHRSDIYAWYAVLGGMGASFGSMFGGWMLQILKDRFNLPDIEGYRALFWVYCLVGLMKLFTTLLVSDQIELSSEELVPTESSSLIANTEGLPQRSRDTSGLLGWLMPNLSSESRRIVPLLSLLFALDAFGSSLAAISWISYYVARKFDISDSTLGSIFFVTGIVGSFASLGGSSISKRLGPLLTMVVTHLPSSSLIIFIPAPNSVSLTVLLLVARACTATMDVAPRQVFLSAVVLKNERTAVMGWVNVVKTGAQVIGPYLTGSLTAAGRQWLSFVIGGSMKVLYDLGILMTFLKVRLDRD